MPPEHKLWRTAPYEAFRRRSMGGWNEYISSLAPSLTVPRRQPVCFQDARLQTRPTDFVKSFGRRQAYESPRGRNPRATVDGYGDFELRPMSAMARPPLGNAEVDADRPLRCASARSGRPCTRLIATLSAAIITMDARGSVAGGWAPAAERWIMPCRVMERSPDSSPSHPAVRAAVSSVRTSR